MWDAMHVAIGDVLFLAYCYSRQPTVKCRHCTGTYPSTQHADTYCSSNIDLYGEFCLSPTAK